MLTIRLTRKGKKNQPFFRVVVIDSKKSSKGGRAVEDLGYKNPLTKKISINKERALYWIKTGAQPSATVHNLLVSEKIIDAQKIVKKSKKQAVSATPATPAPVATPAPEKPAEESKPEITAEAPIAAAPATPTAPEIPASPEPAPAGESKPETATEAQKTEAQ